MNVISMLGTALPRGKQSFHLVQSFPPLPCRSPSIVSMAPNPASRGRGSASSSGGSAVSRIKTAASTLYSENQSLLVDIRRALNLMKDTGVDLEKEKQLEMVKEIEDNYVELLEASDDYTNFSSAIQSVGNGYEEPEEELTDFKKLLAAEVAKLKASSSTAPQNHPLLRHFKEAIWNVHHAGEPMPGEEQEDLVMTSTHCTLLNLTCPLTGKPVIELAEPVRSMDCKHIYEKNAILAHIRSTKTSSKCPITGCPKLLLRDRVVCDPLLLVEIDEQRAMSELIRTEVIEDFTDTCAESE